MPRSLPLGVAVAAGACALAVAGCDADRPRIELLAQRVHDVTPQNPVPSFVVAARVHNPGAAPIELVGEPQLRVRSTRSGGSMAIAATPIGPDGDAALRLAPGQHAEWLFDLWRLSNLYRQGTFRDLRDHPDAMRFVLELATDAGSFESDEWSGVSQGSDVGAMLRELRGGVAL